VVVNTLDEGLQVHYYEEKYRQRTLDESDSATPNSSNADRDLPMARCRTDFEIRDSHGEGLR
jgi:hypothetical protein